MSKNPEVNWDDEADVKIYEQVCQNLADVGMTYLQPAFGGPPEKPTSQVVHETALKIIKLIREGQ